MRICLPVVLFVILMAAAVSTAAPPVGYYDAVDTSTPEALRLSLHEIIDDHTVFPYTSSSTDTWDILEGADENPSNPAHILDVYKNASYQKFGGGVGPYNREHVWPNSYGFPDKGDPPYTDCHHLFLCDVGYNGDRGNRAFAFCESGCVEKTTLSNDGAGGGSGAYPGNSNWRSGDDGGSGSWETWIDRRGDIARAMFYMDVRYEGDVAGEPDLVLTDNRSLISSADGGVAYMGLKSVLLQWHRQDPVDEKERDRNDAVFAYQGNRNPFIDHPEWLDDLETPARPARWSDVKGMFGARSAR